MEPTTSDGPPSIEGENSAKPIRIVIADDHPIFRDGLKQLLSREADFQVIAEVGHGDEVLPAVEMHKPDILLLDLKMPGTHGLTILQRLQLSNPGATKVIVLTGSDDKSEFVHAMKLGTCGIVLKQSPTDLLFKSIRKVYAGEIWLDSDTTTAVMQQFATGGDAHPLPAAASSNGRGRERSPLSQREREIVGLVAQGFKNKEMAEKMFISEQTVKNHLHNIFDKLGVSDRLELALYAIHKKLHLQ
jgi:two-component system, NarL family, nitrate/nitrite response regulator NarL